MTAILATAFAAGLVATVNPCGFAMLPAYLGFLLGEQRTGGGALRAVKVGATVSAGFVSVFLLAGVIVTAGIRTVVGVIPWLAAIVGVGLIVVGAAQLLGRRLLPGITGPSRTRKTTSLRGMVGFGASYGVASLSCTLPIFLALVVGSVVGSGFTQGLATFAAYGAGMTLAVMTFTVAIATGKDRIISRVRPLAQRLDIISGWFLIAAGAFIIWYWATVLRSGAVALADSSLVLFAEQAAAFVAQLVTNNLLLVVLGAAVIVLAGLGLMRRHLPEEPDEADAAVESTVKDRG